MMSEVVLPKYFIWLRLILSHLIINFALFDWPYQLKYRLSLRTVVKVSRCGKMLWKLFCVNIIFMLIIYADCEKWNDITCDEDLKDFKQALASRETWAVRCKKFLNPWRTFIWVISLTVFDLSAKIQSGYLAGNVYNFGQFSECVNFQHQISAERNVKGQHCMIKFTTVRNSTILSKRLEGADFDWSEMSVYQ